MESGDPAQIYSQFVRQVAASRRAWLLTCCGDLVAVLGTAHEILFPLWSDLESARRSAAAQWPNLTPSEYPLSALLRLGLPALVEQGIRVGVGPGPGSDGVVVSARRLQRDLRLRRRCGLTRRRT